MKLKRLIGIVLLGIAGCAREAPENPRPEPVVSAGAAVTMIHNAVIHTVNERQPRAGAMAFDSNGAILAVGSAGELLAAYPGARSNDLGGRTVIPGLIDSHAHLDGLALALTRAQLAGTASKEEVIRRLEAHEATLGEGDWLLGRGWDQNDWPDQEFPSRHDLDARFPDRPVWLERIDGHAGWANSAALALADRELAGDWQLPGGYIHRDAEGQPTGVLVDGAQALVERQVPPESGELLDKALGLALRQVTSLGLTGLHQVGASRAWIERFQRHIEAGTFPVRVYAMSDGAGATLDWLCAAGGLNHPSGRLSARAVKLYMDGALGSRGAALLEDYSDDPGNRGLPFHSPQSLLEQVSRGMDCGFQVAIHAIGDHGNRAALDALEAGQLAHPDNPGRHRIEHAQVLHADDVPRFAALGVIAAMQPTHATSDMYWAEQRLGPERGRFAYAWRSLLDSGARLALGSDFPVEEVNPMLGIYAAVARRDLQGWPEGGWHPGEAISRTEALRGFTLDAAYAAFAEQQVGSLEPGKRADFVVLDRDVMAVPEDEIPATVVLETWLDGERVWAIMND